jgi:hypothetical protein
MTSDIRLRFNVRLIVDRKGGLCGFYTEPRNLPLGLFAHRGHRTLFIPMEWVCGGACARVRAPRMELYAEQ